MLQFAVKTNKIMDLSTVKTVVVKIGTSTLTYENGKMNLRRIDKLCRTLCDLQNGGRRIVLVTSGAIGVGMGKLGLPERPDDTAKKQALAAIGQCELMFAYDKFFGEYHQNVAQVLLTADVTSQPISRRNVENTFRELLDMNVIPIVNENDTVAVDELEGRNFGDNDTLSAIAEVLRDAIESAGLPRDSVQLVQDTSRASSVELMGMTEYLDLLIPRGGAGLIRAVVENAKVPVIETGVGNCHVYVDKDADIEMAANIIFNAKTSRPSVCNAIETILVHKDIAEAALPAISNKLKEKNVELRGDKRTCELLSEAKPATEADWATEYLDYILAVRVVDSLDAAIAHIAQYSTGHSECIVTENLRAAERFTAQVDAAAVYVNASTRFTDGGELGLGAEIGISTQKLHARGPMGLNELVSYKFIIRGDGQIR